MKYQDELGACSANIILCLKELYDFYEPLRDPVIDSASLPMWTNARDLLCKYWDMLKEQSENTLIMTGDRFFKVSHRIFSSDEKIFDLVILNVNGAENTLDVKLELPDSFIIDRGWDLKDFIRGIKAGIYKKQ